MKKKLLLFALIPIMISGLVSCNKEDPKVRLDFGKIHDSTSFDEAEKMSYEELKTKIERKESFAIAISKEPGSCSCWDDFQPILVRFMKKYNLDIKQITAETLAAQEDKFGLFIDYSSMPAIAFFKNGNLVRETAYLSSDSSRKIFKDESGKALESFFFDNAYLPQTSMIYLDRATLDKKITNNEEFNIYYARWACSDCAMLGKDILNDWSKTITEEHLKSTLYVFDMQDYWVNSRTATEEQKKAYQDIKDEYKLSEKYNPEFGFSTGMFPTLQHRKGGEIKDMCVVYNDSYRNDTLTTYFTAERVAKMKYLEGTGDQYVITVDKLTEEQKESFGSYKYELHKPIAQKYISYYLEK